MKLNHLLSVACLAPSLWAQGNVIPLLDCHEKPPSAGPVFLVNAVVPGQTQVGISQAIPSYSQVTINPGAANQETLQLFSITGAPPYSFRALSPPALAHAAGEPVAVSDFLMIGHFGYFNLLSQSVTLPVGTESNFFLPGNPNRGQPAEHAPGFVRRAVSVIATGYASSGTYIDRDFIWILDGGQAVMRRGAEDMACKAGAVPMSGNRFKVARGQTRTGLRLGSLGNFRVTPGSTLQVSVPTVIGGCVSASCTTLVATSDLTIANVRLENGIILGDVTVPATISNLRTYFPLLLIRSSDGTSTQAFAQADVTDPCGLTATAPSPLPSPVSAIPFSMNLSASGGYGPYTFTVDSGTLPPGLSLTSGGTISGTPTQAGGFPFTVQTTAADGCFTTTALNLTVQGASCGLDITRQVQVTLGGLRQNLATRQWTQTVTVFNSSNAAIGGPIALVFDGLSANATMAAPDGFTTCAAPLGRPFLLANLGSQGSLAAGGTVTFNVVFNNAGTTPITYTPRILAGGSQR